MATEGVHQTPTRPRGAIRWTYLSFAGMVTFAALIVWIAEEEPLSYLYLGFFCAVAVALSLVACWEIWTLRAKLAPQWVSNLSVFCSGAGIVTLVVLQETKLFVWNHLYIAIPLILFWALTLIGAWVTEWRKSVRVYAVRGGFAFVSIRPNQLGR